MLTRIAVLLVATHASSHPSLRATWKASMDLVEEVGATHCRMNQKLLQECVGSGGCCQNTNCLFGNCHQVPTPAPLSKRNGHHKKGDVLGNIVEESQDMAEGFGESDKIPITRTHMPKQVDWERLWGAGRKGEDDQNDNMRMPSDPTMHAGHQKVYEFGADELLHGMSVKSAPTPAPTVDYWEESRRKEANDEEKKSMAQMERQNVGTEFNMASYEQAEAAQKKITDSGALSEAALIASKAGVKNALKSLGLSDQTSGTAQQSADVVSGTPQIKKNKYGNYVLGGGSR